MLKQSLDLVLLSYFDHAVKAPKTQGTYHVQNFVDLKPEPDPT